MGAQLQVVNKALHVLTQWNGAGFISSTIRMNKPEVWVMTGGGREGQKVLVEPYIEEFTKFNSNTGWVGPDGGAWNDVLQALSHYSYHVSSGQFLLCDLQGEEGEEGGAEASRRGCARSKESDGRVTPVSPSRWHL